MSHIESTVLCQCMCQHAPYMAMPINGHIVSYCVSVFSQRQMLAMDSDSWKTPSLTLHMLLKAEFVAVFLGKVNGTPTFIGSHKVCQVGSWVGTDAEVIVDTFMQQYM